MVDGVLIALCFLFFPALSHAQPEAVKSAREGVKEEVTKLDGVESKDKELGTKKAALGKIFDLSLTEVGSVRDQLLAIPDEDLEAGFLLLKQDVFLPGLDVFESFLKREKAAFKKTATLDEVRKLANGFNEWRKGNYNPEMEKAFGFLLVVRNGDALQVGDARLLRFVTYAKKAKFKGKPVEWEPLLAAAAASLSDAHAAYEDARAVLLRYVPKENQDDVSDERPPITVSVGNSYNSIREAYQSFVAIAKFFQQ